MAYKEKTCPHCKVVHNKRGPYCSRSCGNHRTFTPEQKEVFSIKKSAWLTSGDDRAEVERWRINATPENEPIPPMVEKPISHNSFVQDGDLWTTD